MKKTFICFAALMLLLSSLLLQPLTSYAASSTPDTSTIEMITDDSAIAEQIKTNGFSENASRAMKTAIAPQTVAATKAWTLAELQYGQEQFGKIDFSTNPVTFTTLAVNNITKNNGDYGYHYKFTLPDDTKSVRVQPGDTLTFQLPIQDVYPTNDSLALIAQSGTKVGDLVVNGQTATITFTQGVTTMNKIEIDAYIASEIFSSTPADGTKKSVTINGQTYQFEYDAPGQYTAFYGKRGDPVANYTDLIFWSVMINYNRENNLNDMIKNLTLTDTLDSNLTLVPIPQDRKTTHPDNLVQDYFNIKCDFGTCSQAEMDSFFSNVEFIPQRDSTGRIGSFTLNFSEDIPVNGKIYSIYYYTQAIDKGIQYSYKNSAVFNYDGGTSGALNQTARVTAANVSGQWASVQINKVDESGDNLPGSKFLLEKFNNSTNDWEVVSEEDATYGNAYFTGVLIGDYRLTETQFPTNYQFGSYSSNLPSSSTVGEKYQFKITADELSTNGSTIQTINVVNKLIPAELQIEKTDANDSSIKLEGAEFTLTNGTDTYTLVTDRVGLASATDLVPGTYTLTEVKAPENYVVDPFQQTVTLTPGQKQTLSITNQKKVPFTLKKIDSLNPALLLPGAEFTLSNGTDSYTIVTDANSEAAVDLPPGSYTLTETVAPTGYQLSTTVDTVNIVANEPLTKPFVNNRTEHQIELTKVNAVSRQPIEGVTFTLQRLNEGTGLFENYSSYVDVPTDKNGQIVFEDLPWGDYKVIEVTSATGYEGKYSQTFTLDKDLTIEIENNPYVSLLVTKVDEEDSTLTLSDASFSLYKQNSLGNFDLLSNTIYTTGINGMFTIPDLTLGKHKLVETSAPIGYILDSSGTDFEVTTADLAQPDVSKLLTVTNKREPVTPTPTTPETASVVVTKVDSDDQSITLSGALFNLYTQNSLGDFDLLNNGLYRTGENGTFTILGLTAGKHKLVEIAAPLGYVLDSSGTEFELTTADLAQITVSQSLTITNKREPVTPTAPSTGSVELTKVDRANETTRLAGARFNLELLNSETGAYVVVTELVSTNDKVVLADLELGTYRLIETQAPAGYRLDTTPTTFTITETALTAKVTITNARRSTGGGGSSGGNGEDPVTPTPVPVPTPEPTPVPVPTPDPEPTPVPVPTPDPEPTPVDEENESDNESGQNDTEMEEEEEGSEDSSFGDGNNNNNSSNTLNENNIPSRIITRTVTTSTPNNTTYNQYQQRLPQTSGIENSFALVGFILLCLGALLLFNRRKAS